MLERNHMEQLYKLEIASIKNMTLKDVSKEKRAKGAAAVAAILGSVASAGIAYGANLPIFMVFYSSPRFIEKSQRLKQDRLDSLTKQDIDYANNIIKIGKNVVSQMLKDNISKTIERKSSFDKAKQLEDRLKNK